jgi:hypothetical protein
MTSRIWYVVAVAALLAGAAGAGTTIWSGISGLNNALIRVVVPGTSELTLAEPGSYTIYHEYESVIDGRIYSSQNVEGLQVSLTEEAGDLTVPVGPVSGSTRYSLGGHSGVSVLSFDIVRSGRYRLTAGYGAGRGGATAVLAIAQGFLGRLLLTIIAAIGLAFAGFAVALAIGLVTFFKRRRMQRAAA